MLQNSLTALLVEDWLCDPAPGTSWAALGAAKKAMTTMHADMATFINADVQLGKHFEQLAPPCMRTLVQAASDTVGFAATVRRPPMPIDLFACALHAVQGDVKSLDGFPVCETLPQLPANLQDGGVAKVLALDDGRLGGVYLASIERIGLEDHPELPLAFISFAARLLKPAILEKPSVMDARVSILQEHDASKGGRTSLRCELGLHARFKRSERKGHEKQASHHRLVNDSLAMAIVAHTVYLNIDLGMSNADVYAWLDELVEDFVAPFYIPRINDAFNGRAHRAQIFGGADFQMSPVGTSSSSTWRLASRSSNRSKPGSDATP